MQLDVDNFEKDHPEQSDDIDALKREIESLRRQLQRTPPTAKPLSWDTELLLRKSENLRESHTVSCSNPNWKEILQCMDIGPDGIRVDDVRTVEHIEFVAAFAARRELAMTYGNRSFHLEPRRTSLD